MEWLLILLVVGVALMALVRRSGSTTPAPLQPTHARLRAEAETHVRPEIEAAAPRMLPEMEPDLERAVASVEMRTEEDEIEDLAPYGIVTRRDYVPKEDEARYLTRDEDGLPTLRFVDAGDRMAIWSPLDGGALINPKGVGLRRLGLYSSYARGADYNRRAYRAADLVKGHWVDLRREPGNAHDPNAVAMCATGSEVPFAYIQRGRAPAVARRMDAGEDMAGVTLRGPGCGSDDDPTLVLVGSRADLTAMLDPLTEVR